MPDFWLRGASVEFGCPRTGTRLKADAICFYPASPGCCTSNTANQNQDRCALTGLLQAARSPGILFLTKVSREGKDLLFPGIFLSQVPYTTEPLVSVLFCICSSLITRARLCAMQVKFQPVRQIVTTTKQTLANAPFRG
jgi:hypothetical protein